MGIALRHVADLVGAFREYRRMLKPGGKLWLLEGTCRSRSSANRLTRFVWKQVIPGMTLLATRSRDAKVLMDYYWDTVEKCVPPETIVDGTAQGGLRRTRSSKSSSPARSASTPQRADANRRPGANRRRSKSKVVLRDVTVFIE